MNKLYWQIRQALGYKNMKMGCIWIRRNPRTRNRSPIIKTYPVRRWGYGYWRNKKRT